MENCLLVLIVMLCIACYTGQTFFNRLFSGAYPGTSESGAAVFAAVYGIVVAAVSLLLNAFRFSPSAITWALGSANAFILFMYNKGMIEAARRGPYAFQSIVMLFGSIVVCLIFSAAYWGDRLNVMQVIGIMLMLCAFILLNTGAEDKKEIKKGYLFWVISLFFTNGIYGVLLDAQQRTVPDQRSEMIIITFAGSAAVSLIFLFITKGKKVSHEFCMGKKALSFALTSSLCAAFAVYVFMLLLQYVPSYILFTVCNGSILVISAVLSALVLKEKPTKMMICGIALAAVSIVLLSI